MRSDVFRVLACAVHTKTTFTLSDLGRYIFLIFLFLLPHGGSGSPLQGAYIFLAVLIFVLGLVKSFKILVSLQPYYVYSLLTNVLVLYIIINALINSAFIFSDGLTSVRDLLGVLVIMYIPFFMFSVIKTRDDLRAICVVIFIVALLNILDSFYQVMTGKDFFYGNERIAGRVTGMFSSGAPLVGSYIGFAYFSVMYLFFERQKYLFFCSFLFLATLILSGNRAMLLSAVLGVLAAIIFCGSYRRMYIKNIAYVIIAGLVIGGVSFSLIQANFGDEIIRRVLSVASISDVVSEQTTKRFAIWEQTIYLIKDNILLGVGYGNFESVHNNYVALVPSSEGNMPHPHQFLLDVLANLGILGLLLSFLLFIYVFDKGILKLREGKLRAVNAFLLFFMFAPFQVTHSITSLFWGVCIFTGIGVILMNHYFYCCANSRIELNEKILYN